jgi:hypothetical protein
MGNEHLHIGLGRVNCLWPSPAVILGFESRAILLSHDCGSRETLIISVIRTSQSQSQCQSYFTTGGLSPITSSWRQAPWDSGPVILFLNGYSPYVTSSLTREWVCCLQLLLVLASVVILRYESRGLMTFYCLRFETPPTWTATSPYFYPTGTGWPGYTPQTLGSLFVASYDSESQSQSYFTTGV